MKKPEANTQQEKAEIEQLSQADLVELVLGLQKIIQELQEKLAIAKELVWELGAIEIGTGTLQKTNQRVAAAVEPAINDLWGWATQQPNVHVDETPCLEKVLYLGKPQDLMVG